MLGYGRNSASKANRVGRLRRIYRGVYAVGRERLDWHGHCMAAVLASQPSVASHTSAGWLGGLLRYRPDAIHVTAPKARRARRDFVVHFADLPAGDRTVVDGIPVTSLARTQLDLSSILTSHQLERMLERCEERGLFDLRAIEDVLNRNSGHSGAGELRRALAIYRPAAAFTRSGVEERFLELVRGAGLSPPAMNYNVAGFELDAYWEPERFAVELDVYETHGTRAAFERDRLRQEDLKLAGIEMTRVTGTRLDREPRQVIARVAALLEQRRREIGA